jgi:CRP-like cAMP-binding protein
MLTIMEKVDLLQNAALFCEVRTQSLARIAAIAQEICFEARQPLFSENEAAVAMFVLLEGEAVMTRFGREERRLGRLQVAGVLSLLANEPQMESARADQPIRALRIGQQDFYDAMAEDFNITRVILRALACLAAER